MITRRDLLTAGIGAAGADCAAPAFTARAPAGATELTPNNLAERVKRVRAGPLMNLEQAYRVMEEQQLDGLVLAENMIISVDCPVRNVGLGGSAHLKDLTLVTADGAIDAPFQNRANCTAPTVLAPYAHGRGFMRAHEPSNCLGD